VAFSVSPTRMPDHHSRARSVQSRAPAVFKRPTPPVPAFLAAARPQPTGAPAPMEGGFCGNPARRPANIYAGSPCLFIANTFVRAITAIQLPMSTFEQVFATASAR